MRGHDSNVRPPGYEPDELPTALPRDIVLQIYDFFDTSQINFDFTDEIIENKKENHNCDSLELVARTRLERASAYSGYEPSIYLIKDLMNNLPCPVFKNFSLFIASFFWLKNST